MKSEYQLPISRADKIKTLKALLHGKLKIEDLKDQGIRITMNLDGVKSFEELQADWDLDAADRKEKGLPPCMYLTLDLR